MLENPGEERKKKLDHEFPEDMKHRTKAMLLSVPGIPYDQKMLNAEPESEGPYVNHSLACFFATHEPPNYAEAVKFLKAAECARS